MPIENRTPNSPYSGAAKEWLQRVSPESIRIEESMYAECNALWVSTETSYLPVASLSLVNGFILRGYR